MKPPAALPSPDAAAIERARQEGYAEGVAWAGQRMPYLLERARQDGARAAGDRVHAAVTAALREYRDGPSADAIEGEFQEPPLRSANL